MLDRNQKGENIKVFLRATNKEEGLENLFGHQQENIFNEFDQFGKVLEALSKLSNLVQKTNHLSKICLST